MVPNITLSVKHQRWSMDLNIVVKRKHNIISLGKSYAQETFNIKSKLCGELIFLTCPKIIVQQNNTLVKMNNTQ